MKIGVDVLGGDYAPHNVVLGAILAQKELHADVKIVLIGDEEASRKILQEQNVDSSLFDFVHTTEAIEMGEHPAKAFQKKPNSSIALGFGLLQQNLIEGFASAGNTGAMLVGATFTVKSIPGVVRPSIPAVIPKLNGGSSCILDVGLNADCKPDVLYQYAILGSYYVEYVLGIKNPKVGLLNIGSEREKGNLLTKATNELMQGSKDFNFIGNVEGHDIFTNEVDVIVCDGFVGNVVLKLCESFSGITRKCFGKNDPFFERLDPDLVGGVPVLGVNSTVVIGHGASSDVAIKNMIIHTADVAKANLSARFKEVFK